MKLRRAWFTAPILVLTVAIILAAGVFYAILTKDRIPNNSNTNRPANSAAAAFCGNGICENAACLSTNCPPAETVASCPADCQEAATGGNDVAPGNNSNANSNQNTNAAPVATLDYTMAPQSIAQTRRCPIEEANMAPADAVAVAARNGLSQGLGKVEVKLEVSDQPLDQCIWTVKNSAASGGRYVSVIDATQEVYRQGSWTP